MGYRIFTDSLGTEWQAWDIVPRLAERRARERRNARLAVDRERRLADERRLVAGERSVLSRGLHQGWLCFETAMEKRRLAPIPSDWLRCTVARLEEYLRSAVPAARASAALAIPVLAHLDRRTG
ncbi:MAG: hypothetical protein JWL60_63 [Gemmatimonadetes bacterium]|jgi:hypothetical protein|nr:hypothetical protein [Gemmatimonadota bacterium]